MHEHVNVCARCPIMDWRPIQGVFQARTEYSWDSTVSQILKASEQENKMKLIK